MYSAYWLTNFKNNLSEEQRSFNLWITAVDLRLLLVQQKQLLILQDIQ